MKQIETDSETSTPESETPSETDRNGFDANIYELRKERKSIREIARILGCSPSKVDRSIRRMISKVADDLGLRHLSHSELQARIFGYAPQALDTIAKLSRSARKEDVQLRASADILDRAGFKPVDRTLNIHAVNEMSGEELRAAFLELIGRIKAR